MAQSDRSPLEQMADRIRLMTNEFHFALSCVHTALNDETEPLSRFWSSEFSVARPRGPPLFTEAARRAILRLIAVDISTQTYIYFHSWFVENKITRPLTKSLLDVLTASFLMQKCHSSAFLHHCAMMAEVAALCYTAGLQDTPDYAIGCILYAIKECLDRGTMNWSIVRQVAEKTIESGDDPIVYFHKIQRARSSVLEPYSLE